MHTLKWRRRAALSLLLPLALAGAACGSSDGNDAASPTTEAPAATSTTAAEAEVLDILVTNDDGVPGDGLDALVEALRKLENTKVTVVAPASNQSGTGDARAGGELVIAETKLLSGYPATSVAGKPADSVIHALETLGLKPHLVVSGVNPGQNIGPFSTISGTVGAAKTAVRKGVPALAASTGTSDLHDYAPTVELVLEWIAEHRAALLAGKAQVEVQSINAPYCATGKLRGLIEDAVLATDFKGRNAADADCASTKPEADIEDDVDASANGFASITVVPVS